MRFSVLPALESPWQGHTVMLLHAALAGLLAVAAALLAVSPGNAALLRVAAAVSLGAAGGVVLAARRRPAWQRLRIQSGTLELVRADTGKTGAHWLAFVRLGPLAWLRLQPEGGRKLTWWIAGGETTRAWALRWHTLQPARMQAAP